MLFGIIRWNRFGYYSLIPKLRLSTNFIKFKNNEISKNKNRFFDEKNYI
jgi:hypothetical protein